MTSRAARPIEALIEAFAACGIDSLVVVPASGLEALCRHFESRGRCIYATREEEAVAIASGLTLGGARTAVVMAQAGVGNALNAVFTLADAYRISFPIVVCFRGSEDPNIVQRVSAEKTRLVLQTLGSRDLAWLAPASGDELASLLGKGQRWIGCSL